jgi:DNA topoisomerase-1
VLEQLQQDLDHILFPPQQDGQDPHICPTCHKGRLGLRLSKFGAFIGCSEYPDCKYTRPLFPNETGEYEAREEPFDRQLGTHPTSGLPISVKRGPYGFYVQVGEGASKKEKPKRISLPKEANPETITLDEAVSLSALPREVGIDPESNEKITAAIGRFGPYVKVGNMFVSLKKTDDVLTVGLERALELIAAKKAAPPRMGRVKKASPAKKKTTVKKKTSGARGKKE